MTTPLDSLLASLQIACVQQQGCPAFALAAESTVCSRDLVPGALHCWRYVTDPAIPIPQAAEKVLGADERDRAACFKLPGHTERYVQTRIVLRHVLSGYVGCRPADLDILRHPQGKPFVLGEDGTVPIHFNLSHSGDEFLLAVSLDRNVGVDVELLRSRGDPVGVARRYFHPAENALIDAEPSESARLATFFRCWTIKEAYVKSIGMGLRCPLSSFDVSEVMQQPEGCALVVDDRNWHCVSWQPSDGSMAAVVVEQK